MDRGPKLPLISFFASVHGRNCLDLLHKGYIEDGVYFINPDGKDFITAFCDQKTNGGGWTVFQRRLDGSIDFFLGWNSYKEGFGDLTKEFWLGNKDIHRSTSRGSQLLIELEDSSSETRHASYGSVFVGTEAEEYILLVSNFSGTAGDSMPTHNGMKFSTKDHDNDISSSSSCAQDYKGAWWYSKCHNANLNGQYGNNNEGEGINWAKWKGIRYSLTSTSMKVKPPRGTISCNGITFFFLIEEQWGWGGGGGKRKFDLDPRHLSIVHHVTALKVCAFIKSWVSLT